MIRVNKLFFKYVFIDFQEEGSGFEREREKH